jgi:hypothetical protein
MARLRLRLGEDGLPHVALVTLSRRNLLALLHKLDMPGSARMLENTDVEIDGRYAEGFHFVIHAEDDPEHYRARIEPPGPLHPQTELFVSEQGGASSTCTPQLPGQIWPCADGES